LIQLPGGIQADAVIFDFDGVIVDTEPLHYAAFQRLLEPLGLGFSWETYVQDYMGFDDRDAFIEAFKGSATGFGDTSLTEMISRKADLFQEIVLDGVTAYPGVIRLIRNIREHRIPLAICSGALRSDIDPILESLQITDCFDIIVTAENVARSKPDPECYQLAYDNLTAFYSCTHPASRVIAIEDTPAGIQAAKKAGLRVLAVTNSYPASRLCDADAIIESLDSEQIICS
jgi:beta-phosphoglucomutase